MPESQPCLDARASLDEIHSLRSEFESAYGRASSYGNPGEAERAAGLRAEIEGRVAALRETVAIHEAERLFDLRRQYDAQTSLLRRARLVEAATEIDGSGVEREMLFMTGIDGNWYPLPSYETVALRMTERRELLSTKADQGFTKLLLVPFGMSLKQLFGKFRAHLIEYEKASHVPSGLLHLDVTMPDWDGSLDHDPDTEGMIVYGVDSFGFDDGGYDKTEILDSARDGGDTAVGWRVLLVQTGKDGKGFRGIPRNGERQTVGAVRPRPDIEAGEIPEDYLEANIASCYSEDSPYQGESGMCPEDWLVAFLAHLEETGKLLDDSSNLEGSGAYLTDAYFTGSDSVPSVYVSHGRIWMGRFELSTPCDPTMGARFVVSV